MQADRDLERTIAELLADPAREGDPMRAALARLYELFTEGAERAEDRLAHLTIVATTLAHEIHNPLAVIRGSVQMLGRIDSVRETAGARIDSIEGATRRIEEIVMRLTELRTLEITGKDGLEHIRLDPETRE